MPGPNTTEEFEEEIGNLEIKILKETLAPYKNSGHAMVALNSLASVEKCVFEFGANISSTARFALGNLWEKIHSINR
jgi:hypothetical protein